MSRQEFTDAEEQRLAEKKFIILEDENGRQYASRIVTLLDAEHHLTKNDKGFYLKTESLFDVSMWADDELVSKSFKTFEEVINYFEAKK